MAGSDGIDSALIQAAATLTAAYFRSCSEIDRMLWSKEHEDVLKLPAEPADMAAHCVQTLIALKAEMAAHGHLPAGDG